MLGKWVVMGLASVAITAGTVHAACAQNVVRIGLILPYSGQDAANGDQIDKGVQLYVKEHMEDLPAGVKIELVVRDDMGSPEVAKRLAQQLIASEHVQILTGLVSSPSAAAIAPLTKEAKVPLVIMNAAGVAIPRISPYVVRVSFTQWQLGLPMGEWAAKSGIKQAYTAVSDFIPGHDAESAFTKGFTDGGGQIVGSLRFPLANPDFAPFVQRIKDAAPEAVFMFVPGGNRATAVMKAWSDLGLKEAGIKLVTTQDVMLDDELPNMGNTPLGIVSSGIYSIAASRPANQAFLAAWKRAYGEKIPNFFAIGGWDGMAAIFDVIKQTNGTFTGEQAMAILKNWRNPDSPRGPIMIDPDTRDIVENIYIRRVENRGEHLANVEFVTVPMLKDPWKELNPPK